MTQQRDRDGRRSEHERRRARCRHDAEATDEARIDVLAGDDAGACRREQRRKGEPLDAERTLVEARRVRDIRENGERVDAGEQHEIARLPIGEHAADRVRETHRRNGPPIRRLVGLLKTHQGHGCETGAIDGHADEDAAPLADDDEPVADQRRDDGPECDDRARKGHGAGKLGARVDIAEQGAGDHGAAGTAEALQRAAVECDRQRVGRSGDQCARDIEGDPRQDDGFAPVSIRGGPENELADGGAEQKHRDDGLHVLDGRPEALLHRPKGRQRDVAGKGVQGEQQPCEHHQKRARHAVAPQSLSSAFRRSLGACTDGHPRHLLIGGGEGQRPQGVFAQVMRICGRALCRRRATRTGADCYSGPDPLSRHCMR